MKDLKVNLKPLMIKLELLLKGVISTDVLSGEYRSSFIGRGTDFVGYREYLPTDDAGMIDWKASVRTNKTLVRELREERNLDILFLFDVSNSMLCSSIEKLKCEYAAELIATLGFAMMGANDKVGLIMFNSKIVELLFPDTGTMTYHRMCKMITNPKNYGGNFDIDPCLRFILNDDEISEGTVVFIVSDFLGLKKGWETTLKSAAHKFMINAIVIRDPIDSTLPDITGSIALSDPYTGKRMVIDPKKTAVHYEDMYRREKEHLKTFLNSLDIEVLEIDTSKPFMGPIVGFFRKLSEAH